MTNGMAGWMVTGADDWLALRQVVGEEKVGDFMFMDVDITPTGRKVWRYKNTNTRRYLNCDLAGGCWEYRVSAANRPEGHYRPQSNGAAIAYAYS